MMRFVDGKFQELSVVAALKVDHEKGRRFEAEARLLRIGGSCDHELGFGDVEQLLGRDIARARAEKDLAS